MKFSTYTLLISASAAIKMQAMEEPVPAEEPVEDQEMKCEWKDNACMGVQVPEGETDMCLILMTEEDCTKGPQDEVALPEEEAGATEEGAQQPEGEVEGQQEGEEPMNDKEQEAGAESEDDMTEDEDAEGSAFPLPVAA